MLCAADTFRAAATEQLERHAKELSIDLVKGNPKSDPSAVLHDCLTSAWAKNKDLIIVDTAGRLQTKTHLMQELAKMRRVCQKFDGNAPQETFLVVDATMGQNAVDQAEVFNNYTPLTGLVLTKTDGSAKGGVAISIQKKVKLPIHFLGNGEGVEDFEAFEAEKFATQLFSQP